MYNESHYDEGDLVVQVEPSWLEKQSSKKREMPKVSCSDCILEFLSQCCTE